MITQCPNIVADGYIEYELSYKFGMIKLYVELDSNILDHNTHSVTTMLIQYKILLLSLLMCHSSLPLY